MNITLEHFNRFYRNNPDYEVFNANVVKGWLKSNVEQLSQVEKSLDSIKDVDTALQISKFQREIKSLKEFTVVSPSTDPLSKALKYEIYFVRRKDVAQEIQKSFDQAFAKAEDADIEKGKKGMIGEIRDWGGKKFKKVSEGKWMEVSDRNMTKKEHEIESEFHTKRGEKATEEGKRDARYHALANKQEADALSDKEHADEEVGLGEKKDTTGKNSGKVSGSDILDLFKDEKEDYNVTKELKVGDKSISINRKLNKTGGQNTLSYLAKEVSDSEYWDVNKLAELINSDKKDSEDIKKLKSEFASLSSDYDSQVDKTGYVSGATFNKWAKLRDKIKEIEPDFDVNQYRK